MLLTLPPAWPQIALQRGLNLILEAPCLGCGAPGRDPWCAGCAAGLDPMPEHRCLRCQGSLDAAQECPLCALAPGGFAPVSVVGRYSGLLRTLLRALKYRGRADIGLVLGARLASSTPSRPAEVVVPIPVHPRRRRERGYNQVEPIAWELGRRLGAAYDPTILCRTESSLPFYRQRKDARWRSAAHAFEVSAERLAGRPVLVVDDILTSGATLFGACRALREAGAAELRVAVVARAVRQVLEQPGPAAGRAGAASEPQKLQGRLRPKA